MQTYAQKTETLQRVQNNAASLIDSSRQSASLQRKADMLDEEEPIQGKSIQRVADEEEEKLA